MATARAPASPPPARPGRRRPPGTRDSEHVHPFLTSTSLCVSPFPGADSPPPHRRPSEEDRERGRIRRAGLAADVITEGAADRRPVDVHHLEVEPVLSGIHRIEVQTDEIL